MGFTNINLETIGVTGGSKYYWENDILRTANGRWNSLGKGFNLQTAQSSGGKYYPGEWDASYFGVYVPHGVRRVDRTFVIQINALKIREFAPKSVKYDFDHWNRTVTTHELGHALGIADNSTDVPSGQYSIDIDPPLSGRFPNRFHDYGYYLNPTSWDAYEADRCSRKSSVP